MFVHQEGVHWCVQEIKARQKWRAQAKSTAAASSQGNQGNREQASDTRAGIFNGFGELWAMKVLFTLGDIPVLCVTAANELVAQKVREKESREVEWLLHYRALSNDSRNTHGRQANPQRGI